VELKKIAKVCNLPNTEWVVIDTKLAYSRHNNARRLAALLGSRYMTLDSLAEF
jgi:Mg-chelatase subunit ChlD